MGLIPLQRLYHINVVVHDLRMTVRNYARIFGITHWEVRNWTPDRLSNSQAYGYRAHFGVAVSSVTDRLPKYASLLGVERWTGVHFRVAPGSLEHSIFNGQVVDNAWLLAITDVADFGMELLQGTREPTDYGQTVERIGEGIHHVLVRRDLSDVEWSALRAWMESMGIAVVMSGRVRWGAAEFYYLDTRAALGGYLLEVIVTHNQPDAPARSASDWRFELDFTTKA